jgi:predicted ATPase
MTTDVLPPSRGNLPVEVSSFVGQARELNEIRRLLSSAHVITLTGPGGIGKSRLALRAARSLARHFPDGVWMVELAELDSPGLLPYALAASLGVHERRDGHDTRPDRADQHGAPLRMVRRRCRR